MSARSPYRVLPLSGEYRDRQAAANEAGAVVYVEQHFNASDDPRAGYACAVVASNASKTSQALARLYASKVAAEFGVPDKGMLSAAVTKRGNGNLRHTAMPALILEPLFASNPKHAEIIRSPEGQRRLARVLVDTLTTHFSGGLIAFSVGHKGQPSRPHDRGAKVHGGGTEADYAELVLGYAKEMLEGDDTGSVCPCCGQPITTT